MDVLMSFGIAGVMLLLGMAIRGKSKFVQSMLIPAAVLGGVIGFICMNTFIPALTDKVSFDGYTTIVNTLFTVSFISIGLTRPAKQRKTVPEPGEVKVDKKGRPKKKKGGPLYRGSMGMGLAWCILFSLQGGLGILLASVVGPLFGMDAVYGMLIPYGFCQGPGQAATNGTVYETVYGITNASQVAITFAVIGFLSAFVVGVPIAKLGIKLGLTKNSSKLSDSVARGFYTKPEQRQSMGKVTTYAGSVETLAFHIALIGLSYLVALVFSWLFSFIPAIGSGLSATMYMNGLLGAYVVNAVVKKLGLDYMQDSTLQSKITGFCSDFLVVMAFMAVQLGAVGSWIVPIVIIAVVITAVTAAVSLFFSQHFGDSNDFERFLGLYGTACGTTPSGLSLVRIVDPALSTTTGAELGMMNMPEMLCTFSFIVIMLIASGVVSPIIGAALLLVMIPIYMAIMKMTGCLNKRTWSLSAKWNAEHPSIAASAETSTGRLQGSLAISPEQTEEAVQSAMA
ncbi:MAG: sodium/glutamate symporter [Candidatus Onthomonas sp.]